MRIFFITILFLVITLTQAQQPIIKTIGDFKTLKVYDLISVELIHSKENKIVISGKDSENVVVINKNGTLKIRMKLEKIFNGNNTEVKLYFTNINIIDANEGSFISSTHKFNQYELDLRAQEGGHLKFHVETKVNEIKADSGGIIELTGNSRSQNIKLTTGGIFNGKNLQSESTKISIRAGGEARVQADKLLDIKIRVGGDVYIYNTPKEVKKNTALGGRIKYIE